MGAGGLEPPRPYGQRILSPLRLPIPPCSRVRQDNHKAWTLDCQRLAEGIELSRWLSELGARGGVRGACPAPDLTIIGVRGLFVNLPPPLTLGQQNGQCP